MSLSCLKFCIFLLVFEIVLYYYHHDYYDIFFFQTSKARRRKLPRCNVGIRNKNKIQIYPKNVDCVFYFG